MLVGMGNSSNDLLTIFCMIQFLCDFCEKDTDKNWLKLALIQEIIPDEKMKRFNVSANPATNSDGSCLCKDCLIELLTQK